jgi:ligand-binding sensor domain-containing protein
LKINDVGITGAIQPNAPSANIFSGITVDLNGNLYSASGRDVSGKGFYKYDGNSWTNYDVVSTPLLPTNAYYNASTTPDGSVYLGSYGRGLLRIKPDGSLIPYTTQNTPLVGISTDPSFLVVAAVKSDSKGNLWILNFDAGNRKTLNMLTTDSTWYGFENSFGIGLTNYSTLEIDQNDVKWFTTPLRNSLFYYSEKGTPANTADDISGQLNESNGMNGQKINALALDKRGDLWVGTDLGVQIITSLSTVLQNSSTAKPRVSTVFSLRQQRINSIVVDPVNRKWVGTDAGLFLVSSDGTSLIAFYDVTNSPLLANEITIMGSDPKEGKIFIGQTGGLISFKTQAPSPNTDYSNLYTYPSPFRPSNGSMMTIDGLIKESDIIILDIAGNKVKSFSSPGGRVANWDGRDENGNVVSTGVYILVASDKEGNTVSKIKFSVVR